jgi:hypothetical protein
MTIPATGAISMSQIRNEHGGSPSGPISLGDYFRYYGYVGNDPWNYGVPWRYSISMGELRGSTKSVTVYYGIIGGGGAGGIGSRNSKTNAGNGAAGESSYFVAYNDREDFPLEWLTQESPGGAGGTGVTETYETKAGRAGEDSIYGAGGAGGDNNEHGSDAPAASWGAGGGGGGGDSPAWDDKSGKAGHGGYAAELVEGYLSVKKGSTIKLQVGAGAPRNDAITLGGDLNYEGGAGAGGYGYVSGYGTSTGGITTWTVV